MYKFYENKEAIPMEPIQARVSVSGEFEAKCRSAFNGSETVEFKGASWHVVQIRVEVDNTAYLIGDFRMRHPEPWCEAILQLA